MCVSRPMSLPYDPLVPRTLRHPKVRRRRLRMLDLPHVAPLTDFARALQAERPETMVPHFDPLDGGTAARVLFLFNKPGPKTDAGTPRGSGFISRDNDGRTAEWTFRLMRFAGVPRQLTVLWNIVPWWDRRRLTTPEELKDGAARCRQLVNLLPLLDSVVLVGESASAAGPLFADEGWRIFESYHPSPRVKAEWAAKWLAIPDEWSRVMEDR